METHTMLSEIYRSVALAFIFLKEWKDKVDKECIQLSKKFDQMKLLENQWRRQVGLRVEISKVL